MNPFASSIAPVDRTLQSPFSHLASLRQQYGSAEVMPGLTERRNDFFQSNPWAAAPIAPPPPTPGTTSFTAQAPAQPAAAAMAGAVAANTTGNSIQRWSRESPWTRAGVDISDPRYQQDVRDRRVARSVSREMAKSRDPRIKAIGREGSRIGATKLDW